MMKKYIPIILSVLFIVGAFLFVNSQKVQTKEVVEQNVVADLGTFAPRKTCARAPQFLKKFNIPQPVVIDLSQKKFKGVAFHFGKNFSKVLHPKIWEQYGYFSTYTTNEKGDIFLVPTPFISIYPTTFNLQKNIYKLNSKTGKISIFMHFDTINPSSTNPYGMNAITYDCDNKTLWAASIDSSDYNTQKGRIFKIHPNQKEVVTTITGIDALSLSVLNSSKSKFLLVGSARDNGLYAYTLEKDKVFKQQKLFSLPLPNERIRKIKVIAKNTLELQSLPFSYALIAQSTKQERTFYIAIWDETTKHWTVSKK